MSLSPEQDNLLELRTACSDGDVTRVSQLFANTSLDAEDATDALGRTKRYKEDLALIRILLENGADVGLIRTRSIPMSNHACELLILLAEYGRDFRSDGHRILQDFARDRKTLDWLLDHGVDINLTDTARLDDGFNLYVGGTDSSLHLLNNVAADGDIDMFDHLVDRGADVSLCTALHSASACKDPDLSMAMVRCLLDKHHMDINRNNDVFRNFFHDAPDRGTPLCSAILNHNLPVVLELLKRGASPREPHMRPVSYAVQENGFVAALEPLLSAGVDDTSALMSAVFHQNLEAAKICLRFGAHPAEALHEALTLEEDRAKERAEDDDDEVSERDVRAERDSKAVIELLRNSIEGGANDQS